MLFLPLNQQPESWLNTRIELLHTSVPRGISAVSDLMGLGRGPRHWIFQMLPVARVENPCFRPTRLHPASSRVYDKAPPGQAISCFEPDTGGFAVPSAPARGPPSDLSPACPGASCPPFPSCTQCHTHTVLPQSRPLVRPGTRTPVNALLTLHQLTLHLEHPFYPTCHRCLPIFPHWL